MFNTDKQKAIPPFHTPVLTTEVINYLNIEKNKTYVDCTLGNGGHSLEILKILNGTGKLIGLDKDKECIEIAKGRLKEFKNCYIYSYSANFLDLKKYLNELNIQKITGGIVLDLGTNSGQLENPERGFSFKSEGPLDMRMDNTHGLTAHQVVNNYNESKLADIIYKYGEERYSRKIARSITSYKTKYGPIQTTKQLANIILNCYPKNKFYKIHPATRTFQAIRIEVNNELENLENFLRISGELLEVKSRLTVISFHSLEDRIVKNFLKNNGKFRVLTKKPVTPSCEEVKNNPRSRSAKLRAAERI